MLRARLPGRRLGARVGDEGDARATSRSSPSSPKEITISFDQFVKFPSIQVYDAAGHTFAGTAVTRGLSVVAPLRKLPERRLHGALACPLGRRPRRLGRLDVRRARARRLPPTDAYGAEGPTRTEHIVRWLYFLSFALLIGSLGFRFWSPPRARVPPRGRASGSTRCPGSESLGAIEVGILAFCLRTEDVLQLPFGKYIYGDLTPIAQGTRFGKAFIIMTLGFAFVSAFLFLAWLLERTVLLVPGARALDRAPLRALALGSRRGRPGLVGRDRARRLGAHLGGLALARRPALARRRGLAGRARDPA